MCGICGTIAIHPPEDFGPARRMMLAMHHRGPDDAGIEALPLGRDANGPAAVFGFRRLSILDLSPTGHQPMVNRRTGDCLVFNGEIYNFRDLRAQLQARGVDFVSSGDTEVLLKALSTWGADAIEMLDGMFALAFYEANTRRVLLARDRLGIKPLYVSRFGERLVFASEVRAILASGLVPDEYDPAGVASYLAFGAPQDPLTVHRHIQSFPCGASQWFFGDQSDRLREEPSRRFWRFPAAEDARRSPAAAAEASKGRISAAVRQHLVSDVPIAVLLSGGIDSGIVAALASRELRSLTTFCVGFESPSMPSELVVARATAKQIGSDHREVVLNSANVLESWEHWLRVADRPSIDGFNTFLVTKAIKDSGVTVACSGLGADELFGGYSNFARISRLSRMIASIAWAPRAVRVRLLAGIMTAVPYQFRHRLMNLASSGNRPVDIAIALRQILTESQLNRLGFRAAELGLQPNFTPSELYDSCELSSNDAFAAAQRTEVYGYMSNTLLRDSDANSMAHSVELRVPFLAKDVVEEAARIPGRIHLEAGRHKAVLRKAFGDMLPAAVLDRPKTGFSLPIRDWLPTKLRDSCETAVDALADLPFLDQANARGMWQEFGRYRNSIPWSRPMLLVALGSYVANRRRDRAERVPHDAAVSISQAFNQ